MVRVRFAPSPTGYLHIGSARTFAFNWFFARKQGGAMILRLDDTDVERNTDVSVQSIFDGLEWLHLGWDEFYKQSDRGALYEQAGREILAKGFGYRDFTPAHQGDDNRPHEGGPWLFNPGAREVSPEESERRAAAGEPFVIRFKVPRGEGRKIRFRDLVYGPQEKAADDVEDFALLRSNGGATYHLASCADDADLKITHIVRGSDHLSNTFKHILIFEALGVTPPEFAHLPLLIAPDGAKLSKRKHGPAVSVTTYRDAGFLPDAYINFISLLGWSPKNDREQMTLEELTQTFSFEGVNRSSATVNFTDADPIDPKALWLNSQHLRTVPVETLLPAVRQKLQASALTAPADDQTFAFIVDLIRARYMTLNDFVDKGRAYFADDFVIAPDALTRLDAPGARELCRELSARLEADSEFTEASIEAALRKLCEERGVKAGVLINASRAALSGQPVGPSVFALFLAIGRDRAIRRLAAV
jgi:glutamyl-tRNA synthetase